MIIFLFFNRKIKEAYLVFDADEAGQKATEAVSLRLKEKGITPYAIKLAALGSAGGVVKDVNVFFKRHTPEEFETLLKQSNPTSIEQSDKVSKRRQSLYKETEHGFITGYGDLSACGHAQAGSMKSKASKEAPHS